MNNNMKFLKSHEWCLLENNTALVGISDHAQGLLGDIVYLELPKVGQKLQQNDAIGVIESVKAASDLYSPLSGEVLAINDEAINNPALINTNPYDLGWLIKIKVDNEQESNQLMDYVEYTKSIKPD